MFVLKFTYDYFLCGLGTQDIIKEFFAKAGLPGQLHQREWKNFSFNRNQALEYILGSEDGQRNGYHTEYILFIDADEELIYDTGTSIYTLPQDGPIVVKNLDIIKQLQEGIENHCDYYYLATHYGEMRYARVQLISAKFSDWKFKGPVHEAVYSSHATGSCILHYVYNMVRPGEGSRSRNPSRYRDDALLLEEALKSEPDNTRYVFYTAQSWKDAGELINALLYYQKRAAMTNGWDQETFYALYQVGRIQEALGFPQEMIVKSYRYSCIGACRPYHSCLFVCLVFVILSIYLLNNSEAHTFRPTRIEAIFRLGTYMMAEPRNNHAIAYDMLKLATNISIPISNDTLFVDSWIYNRGRW